MKSKTGNLPRYGPALGIALLILLCAGNATAGAIPVDSVADEATLFGDGVAHLQGSSAVWNYEDPTFGSALLFLGTITSSIYWDFGAGDIQGGGDDKTFVIYDIAHDATSAASSPFDQFNIDDFLLGDPRLNVSGVVAGGVIGAGPAPDALSTVNGTINIVQYDWFTDPIAPGETTKVFLTYDGLHTPTLYNGEVQDTIVDDRDQQAVLAVATPEPALGIVFGIGLLGMARVARKRINRKSAGTQ